MANMSDKTKIYTDSFFAQDNPDLPRVVIHFRKELGSGNLEDAALWEKMPDAYFESLNLEDNGGMIKMTLNIFDRDFHTIESLILQAVLKVRLQNEVSQSATVSSNIPDFQININQESTTAIRIRFGYGEVSDSSKFINETDITSSNWTGRVDSDKTIQISPWIYFMLTNVVFSNKEGGLGATLEGFSVVDAYLNRLQLIRQNALIRGTPENILNMLSKIVDRATNGKIVFDVSDPPVVPTTEGETGSIEVLIGGPEDLVNPGSKSLKGIINEVLAAIPDKVYQSASESTTTDPQAQLGTQEVTARYNYVILKGTPMTLKFFYPSPNTNQQSKMRVYFWNNYGSSIIKDFQISSKLDWANMNAPILVQNGVNAWLYVAKTGNPTSNIVAAQAVKSGLMSVDDVSQALISQDFNNMFVAKSIKIPDVGTGDDKLIKIQNMVASKITETFNQGIFEGSITIPGDPFYLFDDKLRPYEYSIKLITFRPGYVKDDSSYQENEMSYISGFYLVKGITHSISASGYDTVLAVVRYPLPL